MHRNNEKHVCYKTFWKNAEFIVKLKATSAKLTSCTLARLVKISHFGVKLNYFNQPVWLDFFLQELFRPMQENNNFGISVTIQSKLHVLSHLPICLAYDGIRILGMGASRYYIP